MAYVFNDDKSKANMVYIEKSKLVAGYSTSRDTLSKADLLNTYGIQDIGDYAVLSLMMNNRTPKHYSYTDPNSGDEYEGVYPFILFEPTDDNSPLEVYLWNDSETAQTVNYSIVLMKVK